MTKATFDANRETRLQGPGQARTPKLRVNRAGDRQEEEADRMAGSVARHASRSPRTSSSPKGETSLAPAVEERIRTTLGGGKALEGDTRALMEARFGHDFSRVRIHADARAADMAKSIRARAFTLGSNVFFGAGAYHPHTARGEWLLAHELSHTVQQRAGNGGEVIQRQPEEKPEPAPPKEPSEGDRLREAILKAAVKWLEGENFVSPQKIDDVRKGIVRMPFGSFFGVPVELALPLKKPVKNYTTCVEFGHVALADAARAEHSGAPKEIKEVAGLLAKILNVYFKETQLNANLQVLRKSLELSAKQLDPFAAQEAKLTKRITELEEQKQTEKQEPLEPKLAQELKQRNKAREQVRNAIDKVNRARKELETKIKKLEDDLLNLEKESPALVRTKNGMPSTRPKPGEYVLFAQPPGKKTYGVSKETQVSLPPGSFKHISILREKPKVQGDWEVWRTIDGGGPHALEHFYFVRTSDLLVWDRSDQKPPPDYASPVYMLAGWIDIDKLLEMRKSKAP